MGVSFGSQECFFLVRFRIDIRIFTNMHLITRHVLGSSSSLLNSTISVPKVNLLRRRSRIWMIQLTGNIRSRMVLDDMFFAVTKRGAR